MKFTQEDYNDYIQGRMDSKKVASFLHWMESPEGEKTFQQWVEEQWGEELEKSEPLIIPVKKSALNPNSSNKKGIEWGLWAAVILIFMIASLLLYFSKEGHLPEEYRTEIKITEVQKISPKGKKTKIKLPDGSLVYLNSESSIKYFTDFADNRLVHLQGEAFFEVQSDPNKPFTVITGPVSTQAIGTSFNINAYEEGLEIKVALATGKIRVRHEENGKEIYVDPGEGVDFNLIDAQLTKDLVNIQKILNWKNGILQFEKVPFPHVIKTLERWYGVDFEVKNQKELPQFKCSGTFEPNEYLSNVLSVLAHSLDFNYTIQGKKVILEFK